MANPINIPKPPGNPVQQAAGVVTKPSTPTTGVAGGEVPTGTPVEPPKPYVPPFQIQKLGEVGSYIKLFVYAMYGAGKTRLVGSACLVPAMRDILMIDAESGETTLSTVDEPSWQEGLDHIDRVRITTYRELSRVQEFLKLHCKFRDEDNEDKLKELEMKLKPTCDPNAPARRYRTVIIDSLSEAETYSLYQLLGITDKTRLDEDVASPEWAEYKRNSSQILRTVRAYRDLPMNVLFTCAAKYVQDEQKRFIYQPHLTGNLSKQVQGFMDIVGFMVVTPGESGSEVRRMFVKPNVKFDAKCRFSNYKSAYFDDPTMLSILTSVGLVKSPKGK